MKRVFCLVFVGCWMVLTAAAMADDANAPAPTGSVPHTFHYTPPPGTPPAPASIAGDFNGWKADVNPMTRGSDGSYSCTVAVTPGKHYYKIVYNGKWIADPNDDKSLEQIDGFGGMNSGFIAGADQSTAGAPPQTDAGSPANSAPSSPVNAGGAGAPLVNHTFRYVPPSGMPPAPASIAGDFNGWKADVNTMTRGSDGSYSVTVAVTPGMHYYKVVYNGKWIADPNDDKSLEQIDGFGGMNSGFLAVADTNSTALATHTFHYTPPPGTPPAPASIAGDFNGWKADVNPMTRGSDGSYSCTVAVTPGKHYYKIVYNGKWIADPNDDKSLEQIDGFGGMNSGFIATPDPNADDMASYAFHYTPPQGTPPAAASVVGDFNGWKADVNPMTRNADGSYCVTIPMVPGLHHYKIVYDGKWMTDPDDDKSLEQDDGFGGKNSGVDVEKGSRPASLGPYKPSDGAPIAAPQALMSHTFQYAPPPNTPTVPVSITGEFCDWKPTVPMTRDSDGSYSATVEVPEGLHHYKIVYDGKWITDPKDQKSLEEDDGFGGQNSGFLAGLNADMFPSPTPDAIDAAAVVFDPNDVRDLDVISSTEARLSLHARADDVVTADVVSGNLHTPMALVSSDGGMNLFSAIVPPKPFFFELSKPGAVAYVAEGHAWFETPPKLYNPPSEPPFVTPDWAKHAVWYQILPERFRNGDPSNDPPNTARWTSKWYDLQPGEQTFYSDIWNRRYGGDLEGIRQELPYLRRLGVNAIYLNPIFQAPSLHKYNTTDYRHVDENFGVLGDIEKLKGENDDPSTWQWTESDHLFLDFLAAAHRQGFHVIIDGVYNHVGTSFWAFQDVVKNGKASRYADWFDIIDWTPCVNREGQTIPFHYRAWDGEDGEVPAFKKDPVLGIVHGPREMILAVAKRWLAPDGDPARGVDGFRLDAPENVPHPFWIDFRKMVKSIKPDALVDGEIWPWAQAWLGGDQFDCTMNYQFAVTAKQFFVNNPSVLPPTEMNAACTRLVMNYPFQVALVNQNLLDSHDTDRVASMFVNPDFNFNSSDRIQDSNPNYNTSKPDETQRQRMLQEVVFQMTFVGTPMVYYGDEAGMWGASDPSDRQPMIWQDLEPYDDPQVQFDAGKFAHYQRLIAVHRKLPELQTGFYRKLLADDADQTFAFARDLGDQHAYVVINRSDQPEKVTLKGVEGDKLIDWLDPDSVDMTMNNDRPEVMPRLGGHTLPVAGGSVELKLPAYGSAILSAEHDQSVSSN